MRCCCGYLTGARCRLFAYGPADAAAIIKPHHLLPYSNPDWFYLSGTGLSAVWLYGLGETNEAGEQLEDFCLEHELALANIMFKQHPRRLYTWTSPDGNTRNQIDYISIAHRWKTSLMNCRTYPGADCDTDHQLLVATLKVRLGKRQRQNSIPPLNLE